VASSAPGVKNIAFDARGATEVRLNGDEIDLVLLQAWICKDGDGWKRINDLCGLRSAGEPERYTVYQ
jgi:hypothetical protein